MTWTSAFGREDEARVRRDVAAELEHDLVAVVKDEPPRIDGAPHPVDIDGDGAPEAGETHARERLAPGGEERAEPLAGAAEPDDAGRVDGPRLRAAAGADDVAETERGTADADAGGDDDDASVREQLEVDAESLPERRVTCRRPPRPSVRAPAGGRAGRLRSASAPGPRARRPPGRGASASASRYPAPPGRTRRRGAPRRRRLRRRLVGRPDRHHRRGTDVPPRRLPAGRAGSPRRPDDRCLHRDPARRRAADAVQARRGPAQRRPPDHRPARPEHDHPHAPAGRARRPRLDEGHVPLAGPVQGRDRRLPEADRPRLARQLPDVHEHQGRRDLRAEAAAAVRPDARRSTASASSCTGRRICRRSTRRCSISP